VLEYVLDADLDRLENELGYELEYGLDFVLE
jgi:hypothetical protein